MLQVTNEADIAVEKALRHMLGVFKFIFFLEFLYGDPGFFSEQLLFRNFRLGESHEIS